jgi:hypothetical protein
MTLDSFFLLASLINWRNSLSHSKSSRNTSINSMASCSCVHTDVCGPVVGLSFRTLFFSYERVEWKLWMRSLSISSSLFSPSSSLLYFSHTAL